MSLTGLFALSLSGISVEIILQPATGYKTLLLTIIFVLIGCCIDIGKYLFWISRQRSYYFGFLSVVLLLFSWLASCAFLMSAETSLLNAAQTHSVEYMALEQRISNVNEQIIYQELLLSNRLESTYHSQWEAGEQNAINLSQLRESLALLIESSSQVGVQSASNQVATTKFFSEVGQVLHLSPQLVRLFGYGVLSLLLEICTLGMISLSQSLKAEISQTKTLYTEQKKGVLTIDASHQDSTVQLVADIISGKIPPVLRTIKTAKYGLDLNSIRRVISKLHQDGLLEPDKRNSFKLKQ